MEPEPQRLASVPAAQTMQPRAPEPSRPQPGDRGRTDRPRHRRWWITAVGAIVMAVGAFLWWPTAPASDAMSAATQQRLAEAFEAATPVTLPLVRLPQEATRMLDALQVPPERKQALHEAFDTHQIRLAWIQAWDHLAEDGDVIQVRSAGYTVDIPLRRAPQMIPVPLERGMTQVEITGVRDGGGGITAAVRTAKGRLLVPVLTPGQTLTVPVQ